MRWNIIGLALFSSLFFGANAQGKTRVFVYNNTLQTINVDLSQTDTRLQTKYWTGGAQLIEPSQALEVLSIRKNGGVENNKDYGFKFDVSGDGSTTLVLKIRIEGRGVGRRTYQAVGEGQFFGDQTLRRARWDQRNVQFKQESNGDFMFVIADPSKPVFRFPVQDRTLIEESNSVTKPLGGPFTLDMRTGDRSRGSGLDCLAFDGRKGPPFCYGGHEGTDFMLKGGFRQMDRPGNHVVAARAGTVVEVRQNLYDRCKAKTYSNDASSLFQPDCNGNNQVGGNNLAANRIVVDHGDGLYTSYYHLKKNSALVQEGDEVSCGQPLASIGSSGYSTKPHLHFEVSDCTDGQSCDSWNDRNLVAVNPYNGTYTGRGYWTSQGGGRLPSSLCAPGQPAYQGASTPPARGCKKDPDCGYGYFCNKRIGENRCLPDGTFEVGTACYKNKECNSGKCQGTGSNRVCVCAKDSDCSSGMKCKTRLGKNVCK